MFGVMCGVAHKSDGDYHHTITGNSGRPVTCMCVARDGARVSRCVGNRSFIAKPKPVPPWCQSLSRNVLDILKGNPIKLGRRALDEELVIAQ